MKKILFKIVGIAGFLIVNLALYAQPDTIRISELPDTIFLEETTVSAYRAQWLTPVTFKNISQNEINKVNLGQEPSKILGMTPSINTFSDAGNYQGYSYFRLRGIDQTRINMTLDGIPLNESEDQGAYFSNYPDFFNSVESIQIQRGVGTSNNGVASYAGSINFQSPDLRKDKSIKVGGNYGSYNTWRMFGEYISGVVNDKALYLRVSRLNSDGYKYNSGNKSSSAFVSTGLLKGKHQVKFTGFIGNQKNELAWLGVPLDTIRKDPRSNGNSNESDEFTQALGSIQHTWILAPNARLNSTVYYNYLNGNYDFDMSDYLPFESDTFMYNYAFKHHFAGVFSNLTMVYDKFSFSTGIHLNSFNREHLGGFKNVEKEDYSNTGHKNEASSIFKANYKLFARFNLYGDVQFRHTDFDYEGSVDFDKIQWNMLNMKIGTTFMLSPDVNIYYSLGGSEREPTRTDMFMGFEELPADELGSPVFAELSSEFVFDHEAGIKTHRNNWFIDLNVYYMSFTNELVLIGQYGPNALPLHGNVDKSYRSGFETVGGVKLPFGFSYEANFLVSKNGIEEEGVKFKPVLSPEVIINQGLGYEKGKLGFFLRGKYQSSSYLSFDNSVKIPEFFEVDFSGQFAMKHLLIRAGINNLTDADIFSNGYLDYDGTPLYFVQATRNYFIAFAWMI